MRRNESFQDLMKRVSSGDPGAAEELISLYGDAVMRVIRTRLHRLLRRQLDSDDVGQIVWASFFAHRSLYARFESPEQLLAFLRSMAANKVIDECRRRITTKRRSRLRERGLDSAGIESMDMFVGRDHPPSAWAAVAEQLDRLTPPERRIVERRMEGETTERIAAELGVSERTVYRVLKTLARRHRP